MTGIEKCAHPNLDKLLWSRIAQTEQAQLEMHHADNARTGSNPILPAAKQAFRDWVRVDGSSWMYVLKATLAGLIALLISMRLDLPSPRSAMTTVFVVMQPESGMVFSKSLYRLGGTIIGAVATMLLVAAFAQTPILFLIATAGWICICTFGAAHNRNFRTYGFVLAGYTATSVGVPAMADFSGSFIGATTRLAEVSIGVICAGTVSALIFPQHVKSRLLTAIQRYFIIFLTFSRKAMSGNLTRDELTIAHAQFVANIMELEGARGMAVLEDPEIRIRAGRLAQLNEEFTRLLTRQHTLYRQIDRCLKAGGVNAPAVRELMDRVADALPTSLGDLFAERDVDQAANSLLLLRSELDARVQKSRLLPLGPVNTVMELETTVELVIRFVDDLISFLTMYVSITPPSAKPEKQSEVPFTPRTNPVVAGIAALRAAIVIAGLAWFWYETAWPSGGMAVLNGAAISALAALSARPTQLSVQMTIGTAASAIAGYVFVFSILPNIDGFPLLALALCPFLAVGAFLTSRPQTSGIGIGFCIYFCFLAGPENDMHFSPASYINDSIATVFSLLMTTLLFVTFFPPGANWHFKLLLRDLKRQAVNACLRPQSNIAGSFESTTRDLLWQIMNVADAGTDVRRRVAFDWFFFTLEVGRTSTDIHELVQALEGPREHHLSQRAHAEISSMFEAVAQAISNSSDQTYKRSLSTTSRAISAITDELDKTSPYEPPSHLTQKILIQLHYLRSALMDETCPLNTAQQGE
ncbi:FUSC family protein [Paraburkholderia sp. Ac-20336]|uniref:FUSC family protein n=1 Tax=Paraburkholderia sp. Ac-20336 TaxID=2703886 RepID=UPI001980C3DF|nr:FUSC family protein [Paraburkholderia sp. Ac-20336]